MCMCHFVCADERIFETLGSSQFTAGHNPSSNKAIGFWPLLIIIVIILLALALILIA